MIRNGKLYCDHCFLAIDETLRKHATIKKPLTAGKPEDYWHLHWRHSDDCYPTALKEGRKKREEVLNAI